MNIRQRTEAILHTAERALAAVGSEAVKEGDYDAANLIIEIAREINSFATAARKRLDSRGAKPPESTNGVIGADGSVTVQGQTNIRKRKKSYPSFFREGDTLVKIAWSPSEKAEYEHKSPKKVLVILAAAILKVGNRKRFNMEQIVPVQDPTDGSKIPDYQVYLCLAWFRHLGLVVRHGRKGYSLVCKTLTEAMIETHWSGLATR